MTRKKADFGLTPLRTFAHPTVLHEADESMRRRLDEECDCPPGYKHLPTCPLVTGDEGEAA